MKHIIDDSDKNKYEAYTKEEVLEVIQEAISSGELPEEINGLVLTFKNPVDNQAYKIAFCTQAKYNELVAGGQLEENCVYYITDDASYDDLDNAITTLQAGLENQGNEIEDIKEDINNINQGISDLSDDIADLDERIDTLEGKHLYKHQIEMSGTGTGSQTYKGYAIYFTIYCSQNTALSINDIVNNIGSLNSICASGWASETLQSITKRYPVTRIRATYFADDTYSKNIDIFYLKTEDYVDSAVNDVTGTISDTITQIL